jgi:hypothetical protein
MIEPDLLGDEAPSSAATHAALHQYSVTNSVTSLVTEIVTKKRQPKAKRGRKPLGRKAMTPAQRQARHRQRGKEKAELAARMAAEAKGRRHKELPPPGYHRAKQELQAAGHCFQRVHEEFGREFGGVFVDGAWMDTFDVSKLADMPAQERKQRLDKARHLTKDAACDAVTAYMAALHVSFDELAHYYASSVLQSGSDAAEIRVG